MPENEFPKLRPHPSRSAPDDPPSASIPNRLWPYVELAVTSNFTFLTGASHPDELVRQAAALGYRAVAITDTNTLAGIVRGHVAAKQTGIQYLPGAKLVMEEPAGVTLLVYPTCMEGYKNLCRVLTIGKRRDQKGACRLTLDDVAAHEQGLLAVAVPPSSPEQYATMLARLRSIFDGGRLSLAASTMYGPDDASWLARLQRIALRTGVPLAATNDVHYHVPQRRMLQDVLTCIRAGCTIAEAGLRLFANAERHLKPPEEIHRLFAACPGAIQRSLWIAEQAAGFSLDELRYQYPDEVVPQGRTPMEHLRVLTVEGAAERYPAGVPEKVSRQIEHELALISELSYAPYFLTVHDLVRYARSRGILCQGRGAAANSAVCYCLGVTSVDPDRIDVLFERFVSKERDEPPDIDIDFEHERREEVIQYIYAKYGRDRAALTAEVISYRRRSAVREVSKALGLSLDIIDQMAKSIEWWDKGAVDPAQLRALGLNPDDPMLRRLIQLAGEILGFPRHLSQHVGGFVITRTPLSELVPIENAAMEDRTVIEWDKDDVDAAGMLKIDVLGLGMLTCIRKCLDFVNASGHSPLKLHTIPAEDPAVYDSVCKADTVGVFQIESRAQMSMLPRLRPRCFYDLVIEVAIVRPGPIQGDMVHPFLRRRNNEETPEYHDERVKKVLGKTLGVPLFQEQCMSLAIVAADFTPGEADQLRRAMAAWKRKGDAIFRFGQKIISGMVANGYPRSFAERCFEQIKGFSEYGFPESHAASFALLVYASAWLKLYHPAAFASALINSQPMGFYAPAQIIRDAQEHGVTVRGVDVNHSQWDCTLEGDPRRPEIRLGMRLVKGLARADADLIASAVARDGPFGSIVRLWRVGGARVAALRTLAQADAFGSMGLDRQASLWELRGLSDEPLPLLDGAALEAAEPEQPALPVIPAVSKVVSDYRATGLSLKAHPVSFIRTKLDGAHAIRNADLSDPARTPAGSRVRVAGVVLVRQRPGTASGIVFMTLEDETGIANLIVRPRVYERFRRAARHGVIIICEGKIERQGIVVHVMAARLSSLDGELSSLTARSRDFH